MRRVAGVALAVAWLVGAVASAAEPPPPPKGISFHVRSSEGGLTVESARPSSNPGARPVRSLITKDWIRHPPGTEEVLVTLHNKSGKLLGAYAFPVRRLAFYDQPEKKSNALTGGPRDLPSTDMLVTVPSNKQAASAVFWRVRIRDRAAAPESLPPPGRVIRGSGAFGFVTLTAEPAGFYSLKPPASLPGKLQVPGLSIATDPPPVKLTLTEVINPLMLNRTEFAVAAPPCQFTNLGSSTPNASSFNVVILGDGYQSSEMTDFDSDAEDARDTLLATRPFQEFQAKINVYVIKTPSTQSGVEWCPDNCPNPPNQCDRCPITPDGSSRTTALEVEGNASGLGSCGEFKESFTKVNDAVVTCGVIDPADVHLYIVLVNCYAYGAMAYPASHTVYIARGFASEVLAHEVGHALAPLGEEYISGVLPLPATSCGLTCAPPKLFANVALSGVDRSTASWLYLAKPSEKSGAALAHVEEQSGGTYYTATAPSGTVVGEGQRLGLYWGAQYLTDGPDPGCANCNECPGCRVMSNGSCVTLCMDLAHQGQMNDARSAAFHRPMPYCTMRTLNKPYCRVCYCALRQILTQRTGLTVANNWCVDITPPGNVTDLHRTDDQ